MSNAANMPFMAHLLELRSRLIRIIIVFFIVFVGFFIIRNELYTFVAAPLQKLLPVGSQMVATDVTSTFMAPVKLAFIITLFIIVPYILHQIWGFIAPALYQHEKKLAIPLFFSSVILFYTGVAFAYLLILPTALAFFTHVLPANVALMTDINSYLDFVLKLSLVFGCTFEIPVAVFLLISANIVSSATLIAKRRYIIVGCFFVAMFLTPPDALSMAMLAIPMWLLFEVGLGFGILIERRKAQAN
jgi:sec-independent protein translocase protein TatC